MSVSRRHFMSAVGAAAIVSQSRAVRAKTTSANGSLAVAVIGFRGRGKNLIGALDAAKHARIVALSDVDQEVLHNYRPDDQSLFRTDDFRRILDREDVDAIVSATPNHWHALLTILACQAGKHVYIEKPISHNMLESQAVVAAADRYGKLVQCGFQNRSDTGLRRFFERLHQGDYGQVLAVHGTCHRARASIGKLDAPLEIPSHINYPLWLGPAQDQPILRPRLHYDWHWDFNTGNGDVGNQGPHEWDLINWALGDAVDLPAKMRVAGNRFGWNDAGNTPNVLACAGVVNGVPIRFEVMNLKPGRGAPHGRGVGVIIHTEAGKFVGGRGGGRFTARDGTTEEFHRDPTQSKQDGTKAHMQNFVDAVMAGDRHKLHCDCRIAANSSSMAHMANISYQLGQPASAEALEEAFSDSVDQRDMLARLRESPLIYALQHGTQLREPWLLGSLLEYDHASGSFAGAGAEAANQRMTRDYRSGFELPQISPPV